LPRITVDQGSGPIDADCGNGDPFATFGTQYQCQLQTDLLDLGLITISIHLDDGVDPSGTSPAGQPFTLSDDREITILIK
jgi:hypothetical protein